MTMKFRGKPILGSFDKSFYTDGHDVPAIYIGGQVVEIGDGIGPWGEKSSAHLRWMLDFNKEYVVEIKEVDKNDEKD